MAALLAEIQQQGLWAIFLSLLDIAVVAFFIYHILLLIRGTRAAYMLTGLLLLAGIFFTANQLSLATLGWLLDHLINYILIIVIIVFQADIRSGLSRIGRQMFSSSRSSEDLSFIEGIVQACEAMAQKHIGALIVFERDVDLAEFIDPGTLLEARVSKALLCNIFTPLPDNPLHDGAAIIKGKWIEQAGAVLPLSRNPSLDKALGTRHRAGIGITEETDSIAVIVSEQRGSISLCTSGLLHMGLNGPTLKRELLALLAVGKAPRRPWIKHLLQRWESALGNDEHPKTAPDSRIIISPTKAEPTLTGRAASSTEESVANSRLP